MLDDLINTHAPKTPVTEEEAREEEEQSALKFYETLVGAPKPLHGHTKITQLDAIACLMAIKSQFSPSRSAFETFLTDIGTLLLEDYILPKNIYESNKIIRALKMPHEHINVCPKGCMLFRKEHADAMYYVKCNSSRYIQIDTGDGQKRQLTIA